MPAGADEAEEIFGRDPGGRIILKRMKIDLGEIEEGRIDHDADALRGIVDEGKGRDRAGGDAEPLGEELRLAEAQAPEAETFGDALQIDAAVVLGEDEGGVAVLVDDKQILRMRAGQRLP